MEKKIIMVVDDEPHIRSLLTRMLEKEFTVYMATNGREAIENAARYRPDLVIMDIMMPEVDGYTACSSIKTNAATSQIPIIMLTGVDFPLNKELATRVGAAGYLTKPFNPEDLMKTIHQFLPERN